MAAITCPSRQSTCTLAIALGLVTLIAAGCSENGLSSPPGGLALLLLEAPSAQPGDTIDVLPYYRRIDSTDVLFPAERIGVSGAGQQTVALTLDVVACLADASRQPVGGGCPVRVSIVFRQAGGLVADSQLVGPVNAVPGGEVKPPPVSRRSATATLAVGASHACAIRQDGTWCWGAGGIGTSGGVLGNGGSGGWLHSAAKLASVPQFTSIAAGLLITCALDTGGAAWCWGRNDRGQVGDGTTVLRSVPTAVASPLRFAAISTSFFTSCGLTVSGELWCWGEVPGFAGNQLAPVNIAPPGSAPFSTVSVGNQAVCALTSGGAGYCWGRNFSGALGIGSTLAVTVPTAVTMGLSFASITIGHQNSTIPHSCGLLADGTAYCWGNDTEGALGTTASLPTCTFGTLTFPCALDPTPVGTGLRFTQLSIGNRFTCGRTRSGHAACWGRTPGTTSSSAPGGVISLHAAPSQVEAGDNFVCALLVTDEVYCWGNNLGGQLGTGDDSPSQALPSRAVVWGQIHSMDISPSSDTVQVGSSIQLAAPVVLEPGATGTPTVTWITSNPALATVDANGLVTGVAPATPATLSIQVTVTLGSSMARARASIWVVP